MLPNLFKTVERGTDKYGSGAFGASRGNRTHEGTDFAVAVMSFATGKVTKLGYTYSDDLSYRYVQITDNQGYEVEHFYVEPSVKEGDEVKIGDEIGMLQSLQMRYQGITDHVHLEIHTPQGDAISWEEYERRRYGRAD